MPSVIYDDLGRCYFPHLAAIAVWPLGLITGCDGRVVLAQQSHPDQEFMAVTQFNRINL